MAVGSGPEPCTSDTERWGSVTCSSLSDSDASLVVPIVFDSDNTSPSTDVSELNRARRSTLRKVRKVTGTCMSPR